MKRVFLLLLLVGFNPQSLGSDLGGHLALTLETDTNQGQARDLGADLLIGQWLTGIYVSQRDVSYEETEGSTKVRTQNAGAHASLEGEVWGGGLAYNHYDDGELVITREWSAKVSWQQGPLRLTANARQRQHDLTLALGQATVKDSFDSVGLGLGARWQFDNSASVYANAIHYDYAKDQLLDDTLRQLRLLYLLRPDDRRRLLTALFSVRGANAQVRGNLIANGYSAGADYPIGEHWLSINYTLNEAEVDGSLSESASLYWAHTLTSQLGLDVYLGHARGDQLLDSTYAGLTLHWFID